MLRDPKRQHPPDVIAVDPQYTTLELDRETVMFRCGNRHIAFVGELYVELSALLDGTLTREDIVARLCERFDDASAEYAIDEMLAKGLARPVDRTVYELVHTLPEILSADRNNNGTGALPGSDDESPHIEYDRYGVLKPPSQSGHGDTPSKPH